MDLLSHYTNIYEPLRRLFLLFHIAIQKGEPMNYQGRVESLDFFGNGILHLNQKCYFVKNALPLEEIEFELTEEKKKFAKGYSTNIFRKSPHRKIPACVAYGSCGGCDFQHTDYELEAKAKENHVLRTLQHIGGLRDFNFLPLQKPKKVYNYRNNVTFHMKNGKTCFYRESSHDHIEVSSCYLLEPKLNKAAALISEMNLKDATSVMLRCDNTDHLIAVIFGTRIRDFSSFVGEGKPFTGIVTVNEQGTKVFGNEYLQFNFDGILFKVSYRSFFQIHTEAALEMLSYCTLLLHGGHKNILDLYCGVGSIGQYIASSSANLYGIEIVKDAVTLAKENAERNSLNAKYIVGKTEDRLKNLLKKIPHCDTIILDPPRQGLQKSAAPIITDYGAETILYISCDPASLSRDLKILTEKYNVISVKPFDLFPRTSHVETVCLLSKKEK